MKIAVIGGASTYTPELMEGLIHHATELGLDAVSLMDPDAERLAVVGGFCRRMRERAGAAFRLTATAAMAETLEGADFVITQIRVGGQAGRHRDIQLGLRHGLIGQETTGVGGFAKALRSVPAILALCREMQSRCPRAWLINFTNPSGLVTEAILKHGGVRAIGLCNIPLSLKMDIASFLGVPPERVELDIAGLNHLSWVRHLWVEGRDVLPQALADLARRGRPANFPEELDLPADFLQALGMVPSSYLRYYYLTRRMVAELTARPRSRAEEVMEIEAELLDAYRDPARAEKPAALERRGGAHYSRAAVELVRAIHLDLGERHVVDVANGRTLDCLPADAVVEVPCRIDRAGAHPLPAEPLPASVRGLVQHVKAYEELAVEAAVRRSRKLAILALAAHPLVADVELAVRLVAEIGAVHGIAWEEDA